MRLPIYEIYLCIWFAPSYSLLGTSYSFGLSGINYLGPFGLSPIGALRLMLLRLGFDVL